MKLFFLLLFSLCSVIPALAQSGDSTTQMRQALENLFTWEIENAENGKLMFLDVPYQRGDSDSTQFLTITVAKSAGAARPAFISVIVPEDVSHSDGLFIKFAKNVVSDGEQTIELEESVPVQVAFESCSNGICTARIAGGMAETPHGKEDVFRKFISFDHVFFLLMYTDGSHKSVAVPLFSFQQQYPKL